MTGRGKRSREVLVTLAVLVVAGVVLGRLAAGAEGAGSSSGRSPDIVVLRVIAHSDSPFDQAVKWRVRDAILSQGAALLAPPTAGSPPAAARPENRTRLAEIAGEVLRQAGAGYRATVTFGPDTAFYRSWPPAAGRRYSLNVVLGAGQGHNWWCVIFPPLCLNDLTVADSPPPPALMAMWQQGMGPVPGGDARAAWQRQKEQWEKTPVQVRFAILDWLATHSTIMPGWRSWLLTLEDHDRRQ